MLKKKASFPWYEWLEEFEWDDDEFENRSVPNNCVHGQLGKLYSTVFSRFGELTIKEERGEVGVI